MKEGRKSLEGTLLFHRNSRVWFTFVLSWGLISSIFTFYSSLLIMKMDILIKAVIPVRRQNIVSFNMRLLMNILKRKKKEKIHFAKDFWIFAFIAAGNTTAVAESVTKGVDYCGQIKDPNHPGSVVLHLAAGWGEAGSPVLRQAQSGGVGGLSPAASHHCESDSRGGFSCHTGPCCQRSLHFPSVPFGDGQPGWSQLRVLRKRGALGPSVLELWRRSRVVFSGCYDHRIKSCRQQLAIGACFGNENCSSCINTWVPHWDGLRTGTGSHWCCDIETVENFLC